MEYYVKPVYKKHSGVICNAHGFVVRSLLMNGTKTQHHVLPKLDGVTPLIPDPPPTSFTKLS